MTRGVPPRTLAQVITDQAIADLDADTAAYIDRHSNAQQHIGAGTLNFFRVNTAEEEDIIPITMCEPTCLIAIEPANGRMYQAIKYTTGNSQDLEWKPIPTLADAVGRHGGTIQYD
jgi:hypothetical protein